jgi:hypothetical protein
MQCVSHSLKTFHRLWSSVLHRVCMSLQEGLFHAACVSWRILLEAPACKAPRSHCLSICSAEAFTQARASGNAEAISSALANAGATAAQRCLPTTSSRPSTTPATPRPPPPPPPPPPARVGTRWWPPPPGARPPPPAPPSRLLSSRVSPPPLLLLTPTPRT